MTSYDLTGPPRIDSVLVSENDLANGHLYAHVSNFVQAAKGWEYTDDELPRDAVLISYVGLYLGEVCNGGHKQFVGNLGWSTEFGRQVRESLQALGDDEVVRIFIDFESFTRKHSARFHRVLTEEGYHDLFLDALDRRVYEKSDALRAAMNTFCRRGLGDWLVALPDGQYPAKGSMRWHPDAEARRDARRKPGSRSWVSDLLEYLKPPTQH